MKKLIAFTSIALSAVFAVALINSEAGENYGKPSAESSEIKKDHWASASSCTDDSGITHKRGQKGFESCVQVMRDQEHEMSGEVYIEEEQAATVEQAAPEKSKSGSKYKLDKDTVDTGSTYY